MDELETQLNEAVDNSEVQEETQTQNADTQTAEDNTQNEQPQTLHDILNGKEGNTQPVQNELWKQSKNFEKGLWKTPDDVYKSVQYYEQKYQPLEQSLSRMGFKSPVELEQALKDYQDKIPVYQENEAVINQLNALLQNETYGPKLKAALDEIRRGQQAERYGVAFDDLPPVIKEKVLKGEQALQMVEEMKQEQAYQTALGTIQEQMQQIEQIAQETGLDFDNKAFLEYCRDKNISPQNMKGEFLNAYYTQMLEKAKQNASLATTVKNKQNKANALNSSTKQQTAQSQMPKMNDIYDLEQALNNID